MGERQTEGIPRLEVPAYDDVDLEICLRDPETGELRAFISLMHLLEWIKDQIILRKLWKENDEGNDGPTINLC